MPPLDVLVNNAALRTFIAQTEQSVVPRCGRYSRTHPAWCDVLHARSGKTLDRGTAQGCGAEHPLDIDHHRPRLITVPYWRWRNRPCWR